jgi:hypothetical protein
MANLLQSGYTAALKEVLLPFIRDNLPKQTIALDQFKRNGNAQMINDEFIAPVYTSRHGGVAALADDGNNITQASGRNTSRGTVSRKILTGALDISDLAIKSSRGELAVENALEAQTKTLVNDFGRSLNRQIYGDGYGIVAQVRGTGGSVSGTEAALEIPDANLDDGRSIDWYGTINNDVDSLKYLTTDQHVGIGTAGAVDGTVSATTGTTIQLTGTASIAAYDSIYIQDGSNEGAGTSEIQGVRLALSSTTGTNTYAGLARNVQGWTPQFGSASAALSMSILEDSYLSATEYAQTTDKFVILVNKTLYKRYGDILVAMRRTVNKADLLGGWQGLEFAAGGAVVGVFLDFDVPDGEALVLNLDTWTICQVSDIDWLEDPNGGGLMRLDSTLIYQAVMVWYANVLCLAPAANGRETRKED